MLILFSHWVMCDSFNPWTIAHQAPLSMGFPRWEFWSGLPFPSPGDLPNLGTEPESPALQADSLSSEPMTQRLNNELGGCFYFPLIKFLLEIFFEIFLMQWHLLCGSFPLLCGYVFSAMVPSLFWVHGAFWEIIELWPLTSKYAIYVNVITHTKLYLKFQKAHRFPGSIHGPR